VARFSSNENFPLPVVEELRRLGHDALTIQESGHAGRGVLDEVVLEQAISDGRAVFTINRKHFIALHGKRPEHYGIVVGTVEKDFAGQAARIHAAVGQAGDLRGKLIRVNRPAS